MTQDNGWLDQMIEQEPQARDHFEPGDEFAPTGDETDLNLLYTDLLAEPDVDSDPFANGTIPAAEPTAPGSDA
jgi:hypothetical protein